MVVAVTAFWLVRVAPGDPAGILLRASGTEPTADAIEGQRRLMGLDRPMAVQFARWVGDVARGDLGRSFRDARPVGDALSSAFVTTIRISLVAWLSTMALAFVLAATAARHAGGRLDRALMHGAAGLSALPGFVVGLLLMRIVAVEWRLLPVAGTGSMRHAILPVVTLAATGLGPQTRLLRAGLLDAWQAPFVEGLRARGLRERAILTRHLLRLAAPPSVAASMVLLANMVVGSTLIEPLFAVPGLGRLAVDAIGQRDQPIIQGYVLLVGTVYLALLAIADLTSFRIDPRAADSYA